MMGGLDGTLMVAAFARLAARSGAARAEAAGTWVGDLRRRMRPREMDAVRGNLALLGIAAPARDARAREVFHAFGLFAVEFFRGLEATPDELAAGWSIEGWEHLAALAREPAGFILAGAHTGNWEHLAALGPLCGRRILVPTGTQFHAALSAAVKARKERAGIVSVSTRHGLRRLAAGLAQGDLVGLPIDGGSFLQGLAVPFLGRQVVFPAGAARLALLSGRPIVPAFSRRTSFMRQEVRIEAPIWPPRAGEGESARTRGATELTAQLAEHLSKFLRTATGQWCIFRPLGRPGDD